MTAAEANKKYVRVDPFASTDICRAHGLNASDAWTLLCLAMHADWRSGVWTGTLSELAGLTLQGTKTAPRVVDRLKRCGLVETLSPFKQASEGKLLVRVHPEIVRVGTRYQQPAVDGENASFNANGKASFDADSEPPDRVEIASRSRRDRVHIRTFDANEQGKGPLSRVSRQQGRKEIRNPLPRKRESTRTQPPTSLPSQPLCRSDAPMDGHPFDHEPEAECVLDETDYYDECEPVGFDAGDHPPDDAPPPDADLFAEDESETEEVFG
jgi:hypothetical protein